MKNNKLSISELFIEGGKLPNPIAKDELDILFEQVKNGSREAREIIIIHNIRLVLYIVNSKFQKVNYNKQDLVSVGNLGLIKAVDNYDKSKGVEFGKYASKCINNEILMFLRHLRKDIKTINSLYQEISDSNDENYDKSEEFLYDNDVEEKVIMIDTYKFIREVINNLPHKYSKIIMLYFGFYNDKIYTQKEIANKLNFSQPYISRLLVKLIKKITKILEAEGIIELHSKQDFKPSVIEKINDVNQAEKNKTQTRKKILH